MPTAQQTALAELTAEQRAVLADPAISARFEEFMVEALAATPSKSRWWGATSVGYYLRVDGMVRHAEYTVGLERRRAEIAAEAMGRAA